MVEDDDSFAEALRELLEADGRLEVAGRARNGSEAIELAEALRPDVVLMDIVLPMVDGVEATREIRRKQPTIPVVAITGSEYEERALEVQDAGAVDFIRKGRLDPDLVEIVVAAARHRRRAAAAAQRAAEQRSSQRTNLSPDSDFQSGRSPHYWPRQCRQHSSFGECAPETAVSCARLACTAVGDSFRSHAHVQLVSNGFRRVPLAMLGAPGT